MVERRGRLFYTSSVSESEVTPRQEGTLGDYEIEHAGMFAVHPTMDVKED